MVVLNDRLYYDIVSEIQEFNGLSRQCKDILIEKYPDIPAPTLGSIVSNQWQIKMKIAFRKSSRMEEHYYNMYQKRKDNGESTGIILRLSVELNIAPALLATSILRHTHKIVHDSSPNLKEELKDTSLINDRDLAYEIYLCNLYDNDYGHVSNIIKKCVGKEYEYRLEEELKRLNIAYIDENVLRSKGYDKTPDFKLVIPIAVDGFVINWIESKALFGDGSLHAGYLKDQLLCYWNRFGPGLVIYWFGYVDSLEATNENNSKIILRDAFPQLKSITTMDPALIE